MILYYDLALGMGTFSGTLCLSVPGLLSVGVTRTLSEFLGTLSQLI